MRDDTVYLCGITADPVGDITAQTQQVLDRIDAALQKAGTDKSKPHRPGSGWRTCRCSRRTTRWNACGSANPPVRACVRPTSRVQASRETAVTAAR